MKTASSDDAIDCALLAAAANSDRAAFTLLYRRHEVRVHGYVKSIVRDSQAAEDIVVATMTTVWQMAASFAARSRVSTWILGIARHKALDELRLRLHTPVTTPLESAAEPEEPAPAAIELVGAEQLTRSMRQAMSQLSSEHQEALRLAFYEDLPYGDIAVLLAIPVNTVKSRVFYAKQELRRHLTAAQPLLQSTH